MATSSLLHDDDVPPTVTKGHGTAALGPSDTTDSGSDIQGGPGLNRDDGLLDPTGTTSDPDIDGEGATAGADMGDANLDSDSDSGGTGERAAAGRDSTLPTDQLLRDETGQLIDGESIGDEVDSDRPTGDELVGADVVTADLDDDDVRRPLAGSYRPAQAGQDARPAAPSGTRTRNEPGETHYARADGKRKPEGDDVPVFDRGGREDLPGGRRR
ncbi:MAG: hypothetical protein U1F48_01245 [Burkholderiales bacterium]